MHLEQLVFQSHVRLRLKTDTSTEDVRQGTTLLSKCIDDRSSGWCQRGLEHVAEDAENGVEVLKVLGGSTVIGG